ncbi:MAG: histidine kinase [Spirochaetae bacterium HGW-Spirochaetae-3]|jgi:excisionase family DNA binding protein|nr:MAG: histidine kinase [Spirochaetae bacterium HGW-Spirochaetae-3]
MAKAPRKIRIFSALEVANLCGVVNQTAINWIRNGYLKAFMTPGGQYRIYLEDLVAFLEQRKMRVPAELVTATHSDVDWSRLVIIDDDAELNDIVKKFIEKGPLAFTILQAFDGFEAGALLTDKRPGFVILDIDLPGLDGNQICHKIKNEPAFGKPFVITITGLDTDEIKDRALEAGSDAFLPKPLDFDLLGSILADFAGKVR